jgi:hypothetical protein
MKSKQIVSAKAFHELSLVGATGRFAAELVACSLALVLSLPIVERRAHGSGTPERSEIGCEPAVELGTVPQGMIDCGSARLDRRRLKVDTCATKALRARRRFIARYEARGTDSPFWFAVIGRGQGAVVVVGYYPPPCPDHSPRCPAPMVAELCEGPRLRSLASPGSALTERPVDCTVTRTIPICTEESPRAAPRKGATNVPR